MVVSSREVWSWTSVFSISIMGWTLESLVAMELPPFAADIGLCSRTLDAELAA